MSPSAIRPLILVFSVFLAAENLRAQVCGLWFTAEPMPSARQEISTAALNGQIFVIAGYDSDAQSTDTVYVFDPPPTNTWSSAAPLPIATNHNAAAVAASMI